MFCKIKECYFGVENRLKKVNCKIEMLVLEALTIYCSNVAAYKAHILSTLPINWVFAPQ